jgi:hypothetical protein
MCLKTPHNPHTEPWDQFLKYKNKKKNVTSN